MTTRSKYSNAARALVSASIFGVGGAACLSPEPPAQEDHANGVVTKSLHEFTDPTGEMTIQIRSCGPSPKAQHTEFPCELPDPDYLLVGGGAVVNYPKHGALLTASEPHPDKYWTTWRAAAKDHMIAEEHQVTAWVIGMKFRNITASDLRSYLGYYQDTSVAGMFNATAIIPADMVLLGGGGAVLPADNPRDPGALLTGSFPNGSRTWRTEAKDHIKESEAKVRSWAIGLNPAFTARYSLEVQHKWTEPVETKIRQRGDATAWVDDGFMALGGGGRVTWSGLTGRVLWSMDPWIDRFTVRDKDHVYSDKGTIESFVVQARVNKPE